MRDADDLDIEPDELRRLGEQVVELLVETLEREPRDPVLPPVDGPATRAALDAPLPRAGAPAAGLIDELRRLLGPLGRRNGHPRFFAYVCSSVDPLGALASALAAAWNQNVTAWRSAPGAAEMERLVLRWLDELVGFGGGGRGLLTSGGSAANFTAIAAAVRRATARVGLPFHERGRLVVYTSREGHLSLRKAARLLAIADEDVRAIGIDGERRMRVDELEAQLASDVGDGRIPACVCASAGTANTGAVDPLEELAALCRERDVWLHVDGAYGAPAAALDEHAAMRRGLGRADSLSLDPHKWLFAPLGTGCLLLRDEAAAVAAFSEDSEYTRVEQESPIEAHAFFDLGLELSRPARALVVWTLLKARGADALVRVIGRNVALRRHLDARVEAHPRLEALGSGLSIACFRYRPPGDPSPREVDDANRAILSAVAEGGRALMSPTTLDGRYALRACIVNHRTRREDVDLLVEEVVAIGDRG